MLAVWGGADMLSVYVRQTIIQLATPDEVRGRVNAVSSVAINASNELGDFRAGLMAAWITTVPAVVVGGVVTIARRRTVGVVCFLTYDASTGSTIYKEEHTLPRRTCRPLNGLPAGASTRRPEQSRHSLRQSAGRRSRSSCAQTVR